MHFDIERAVGGGFLWRLVGDDNRVLATSEPRPSKRASQEAIAAVKREAAAARVHDHTGGIDRP